MESIAKSEFYGILTDLDSLGVRKTAVRRGRSPSLVSRINVAKRYIDSCDLVGLREALNEKRTSRTFYGYAEKMIRAQEKAEDRKPEMLVYSPVTAVANELIKTMNECAALLTELMDMFPGKEGKD